MRAKPGISLDTSNYNQPAAPSKPGNMFAKKRPSPVANDNSDLGGHVRAQSSASSILNDLPTKSQKFIPFRLGAGSVSQLSPHDEPQIAEAMNEAERPVTSPKGGTAIRDADRRLQLLKSKLNNAAMQKIASKLLKQKKVGAASQTSNLPVLSVAQIDKVVR